MPCPPGPCSPARRGVACSLCASFDPANPGETAEPVRGRGRARADARRGGRRAAGRGADADGRVALQRAREIAAEVRRARGGGRIDASRRFRDPGPGHHRRSAAAGGEASGRRRAARLHSSCPAGCADRRSCVRRLAGGGSGGALRHGGSARCRGDDPGVRGGAAVGPRERRRGWSGPRAPGRAGRAHERPATGVRPDGQVLYGEAGAMLLDEAEKGVDLLFMGSHAWGPVHRALLGSVSATVRASSPCPVVIVPRGSRVESGQ